jgi:Predicted flavin-nucleotide-binding protein structurally related to pyridoxine 5''-phosphate oxidase
MPHPYADLMFTPSVRAVQQENDSRRVYMRFDDDPTPINAALTDEEKNFIAKRDSFYLATLTENDWPYVQHRGGKTGFLKVLDDVTLGFADYPGNRQYITTGNLRVNDRVSLFLMDYPNKRRLKIAGHARIVLEQDDTELFARLRDLYEGKPERAIVISMIGFDWNCNQYITQRYPKEEVDALKQEVKRLQDENTKLRAQLERS